MCSMKEGNIEGSEVRVGLLLAVNQGLRLLSNSFQNANRLTKLRDTN
jgi:hypothetical protein